MSKSNNKSKIRFICYAAAIAALYVVLTWLSSVFGLSSGVIQCRISEALCVLVYFTPAAIPGLTIGCLISNIMTGAVVWDVIFGTLATLIGAIVGYLIRKCKWLVPMPTVVANTVIVPFVLRYAYGAPDAMWFMILTVGAGEVISAWILGYVLLFPLEKLNKHKKIF